MRLERLVARRLGVVRRQARRYIRAGRVSIDGQTARDPALRVGAEAELEVDGEPLAPAPRLVAYHKPVGVHCTVGDPLGRRSLEDVAGQWLRLGLHPVGRLDADSEGLLLLCGDGALTQRLLHPKHGTPKRYEAVVQADPPGDLASRLAAGVSTAAGTHTAELVSVSERTITLVVREGKHRMVRRMLANIGLPVVRLRRLAMGPYELGDLAPGAFRVEELARGS